MRPGTKKGKLDRRPIWVVEIQMPKKLIADIYTGYREAAFIDPTQVPVVTPDANAQPAEDAAMDAVAPEEAAVE
jgi:hypothetical protein